ELPTDRVATLISHAMRSPNVDGFLFCRCRATLSNPWFTLHPHKTKNLFGDVYLERKTWSQIWIHQILRAKVLRHLFTHLPDHIPSAKAMDDLKDEVPKLPEQRLFVTEKNYAVFGESTRKGDITQNCYESIVEAGIELPEWFHQPTGEYVTLGKLESPIALRTCNRSARSPQQTACAQIREAHHRNISSNVRGWSGCIAVVMWAKCSVFRRRYESRRPDFRSAWCNRRWRTGRPRSFRAADNPKWIQLPKSSC